MKKQKFIILTAVPDTIFLFVKCKTGTSIEVKLAFPAKIQNKNAINLVLILKIKQAQINKRQKKVIIDAFLRKATL